MAVTFLGDSNPDGMQIGVATGDKLGFLGTTPVSRQTTWTAVTTQASTSTTPYGYATTTQANGAVTALAACKTALDAYGLLA